MSEVKRIHPITGAVLAHLQTPTAKYVMQTGGTHSGKTYSILEAMILFAASTKAGKTPETSRILVSGKDLARLWDGVMPIMDSIFAAYPEIAAMMVFNVQAKRYTFRTGWTIQFAATDNVGKVKSLGKCYAHFIDEIDNVPAPIWDTAADRATVMVGAWNPSVEFEIEQTRRADKSGRTVFYTTNLMHTYNAGLLSEDRYRDLVAKKNELGENHFWTQVYFCGRKGVVESRAFREVYRCDTFPECETWCYGGDYGYSPDPLALAKVGLYAGDWYIEPLIYQTLIEPHNYATVFASATGNDRRTPMILDSAPDAFHLSLRSAGFNAIPAKKGAGSIEDGVAKLAARKIYIVGRTRESDAAYKEFTTYARKANPLGGYFPDRFTPTFGDHIIDSARYAVRFLSEIKPPIKNYANTRVAHAN